MFLYIHFPVLYKQIVSGFVARRDALREQRRAALRDDVRSAVAELVQRDLHPSVNNVIPFLRVEVGRDWKRIRQEIDRAMGSALGTGKHKAPALVSEWLEALNWAEIQRVHEEADPRLSPVALVYADIADKNKPLFSPAFLRREFFPRLRSLVAAWHAHGIKVIFHSDGNLWPVLDDFRASGIDGLNPLEPLSGMSVEAVAPACPNWILMGGIDATQLLPFGREDQVRAAVRRAIAGAGGCGRLWLGSSTEIHPAVKVENVLAMWDEIERCGYYEFATALRNVAV